MLKRLTRNAIVAILAIASALSMAALLAACAKGGGYKTDVAAADLAAAVEAGITDSDGLIEPGDSYISGSMKLDPAALGEFVIKISSYSTNINEYGVFKAAGEDEAKALAATLEDYLVMRNDAWMSEYLPDQYPKLQDAEVRTRGQYVMYAILDSSDREEVFAEFDNMLKK